MARTPTFYVLHGDDEFSLKAEVKSIRAKMGEPSMAEFNTSRMDGKDIRAGEVISAVQSMPFMGDKRLVIVEGMITWYTRKGAGKTGKAEMEALEAALPDLPSSSRLVLVEYQTLDESNPILKAAKTLPNGYHKEFNPPRDATNWIIKNVEAMGGKIEQSAAAALAGVIGGDLRTAESECYKLLTFVGVDRAITEADVALLTPYTSEAGIFEITDALGKRDGVRASKLIQRLLANPKEEPLRIFSMINRQFRILLQVREVLDAGGNVSLLPDLQRMGGDTRSSLLAQAKNFTLAQLEDIYHRLVEIDFEIKTGQVEDVLALDLFVAAVSS